MSSSRPLLLTLGLFCAITSCSALRGPQGAPGVAGPSCVVSQTSEGALITCPDGSSALASDGAAGEAGPAGLQGLQGPAGTNATPVTTVQFCPNTTPAYPSTFPEFGICIGGQLYGVYSQNGGFLALLPPGEYDSNAVGSSCTFTILDDCQIQN